MGLHYTMHLVGVLLVMTLLTEVRQFLHVTGNFYTCTGHM